MKAFLDGYSFSIEERDGVLRAVFKRSAEELPEGRRSIATQMKLSEPVLSQTISDLISRGDTDTTFAEQALDALHAAQEAKKSRRLAHVPK